MTASIINGKLVASNIKKKIQRLVSQRVQQGHRAPGLAVILVGMDKASKIYVHHKRADCTEVGFHSLAYDLPEDSSEKNLTALIDKLNEDATVDGILVQLPLPKHINTKEILERIAPYKDVDGFHPYNLGRLAQGNPMLRPCTPFGIIQLLEHYKIPLKGKHAVVVGASNIVGRPMALELLLAKATVTICHSATQSLEQHIRLANLVVVATGSYDVVKADWLHEGQIIIDVGMHRGNDGALHGDVNFQKACEKVAWITPVPGGIGPMTRCALLQNTLIAQGLTMDPNHPNQTRR
ncbi:MAG: bifunctional methylenetetrahydrofolate dehydrogenase/methenyltetrahydrofolate cyclohydrolase FolD [Legionellales bacterium]|nr:bifunctional methylenetetrahydrofolate dehydrogenase/methenyltetrahydrofolate cyclohydrolase FolD [Legionellales bacterium]